IDILPHLWERHRALRERALLPPEVDAIADQLLQLLAPSSWWTGANFCQQPNAKSRARRDNQSFWMVKSRATPLLLVCIRAATFIALACPSHQRIFSRSVWRPTSGASGKPGS